MANIATFTGASALVPSPQKITELRVLKIKDRGSISTGFRFMLDFEDTGHRKGWLQTDFSFEIGDAFGIFNEGGKTYIVFPRSHPPTQHGAGVMAFARQLFPVHSIPRKEHIMNELIAITSRSMDGKEIPTVNARELHAFLEVQTPFKDWIARRIEEYGFQEGKDFCAFLRESSGGRPAKEYALSIDMAKELSMVERNEKGKQARQYFLECERRAKTPAPMEALADPAFLRSTLLSYTEKVIALEAKVEEQAPKVAALDRIEASPEHLTLTQAAKVLNIKIGKLTELLHRERWVYRQNGSWVPYHPRIEQGLLIYKEAKYTDENAGVECIKPYCHITQKGIAKLAAKYGQAPLLD